MRERIIYEHLLDMRRGSVPGLIPEATTFLAPDYKPGRVEGKPGYWKPVNPSLATRLPPARSRGHSRGFIIDPATDRRVVYESQLERIMAYVLAADPRVAQLYDQPEAIVYRKRDGSVHKHTLDFIAVSTTGKRTGIAVKPTEHLKSSEIEDTISLIEQQTAGRVADRFIIMTERSLTGTQGHNASTIVWAREDRNAADVAAAASAVVTLNGGAMLGDLIPLCTTINPARARTAIINLIDEGVLAMVGNGRIDERAEVRPGRRRVVQ